MNRSQRNFIVIADDYGLGPKHNSVMRDLLKMGALDGVSVLVSDEIKGRESKKLLSLTARTGQQIGLHLNLTHPMPGLSFVEPLGKLLIGSITGHLDVAAVRQSIDRQLDIFEAAFGQLPDFVDGHQHCHCFPAVSDVVLSAAKERMSARPFWIRSPCPSTMRGVFAAIRLGGMKSLIIMALGTRIRHRLKGAGIQTNDDFAGIMRLDTEEGIEERLRYILDAAGAGCVVMTHPGDRGDPRQVPDHEPRSRTREARLLLTLLGDKAY